MSFRPFLLGLAAAAALLGPAAARAADLDDSFSYAEAPEPLPQAKVEFGTGWYVRGDLGATHGLGVNAGDEPYNTSLYTAVPARPAVAAVAAQPATTRTYVDGTGATITETTPAVAAVPAQPAMPAQQFQRGIFSGPGQTPPGLNAASTGGINYTASLGAGYQFNRWFRSDLIFDFHQPIQSVHQGVGRQCLTGMAGVGPTPYQYEVPYTATCTPDLKATLKSYDILLNGYVDAGTWYGFTPYVGAGLGLSFGYAGATSHYIQNNGVPYNATYVDAINGGTYNQFWDRSVSKQYYNFAYAFMGGVAYDIFPHTKLDVGYRYTHLGQILGTNVATQEVRAGLRYMVDN